MKTVCGLALFLAIFLVVGCNVEAAREAGERAAGNQQEERQNSGRQKPSEGETPETETDTPDVSEGSGQEDAVRTEEDASSTDDGVSGEDAARPTSVYESNRTGIIFHFPADWDTSLIPPPNEIRTGGEPIEEIQLKSPDGGALIQVQVYQLDLVVDESNLPRVEEEMDRVYESLAEQLGGEVEYAGRFERGSLSGKEYRLVAEDGYTARVFSAVERDRQYVVQLETTNEADQERHEDVLEEVVESFEVLPASGEVN